MKVLRDEIFAGRIRLRESVGLVNLTACSVCGLEFGDARFNGSKENQAKISRELGSERCRALLEGPNCFRIRDA
jgi:hypothetical protein